MRKHLLLLTIGASLSVMGVGCHKKAAMVTPPPAPAAAPAPAPAPPPARQRPAVVAETPKPASRPEPAVSRNTPKSLEDLLNQLLDAYFDYDQAVLRTDAQTALNKNSSALRELLKEFPDTKFLVEGNCDERGSAEYNLALGDRRAAAAKEFLTQIGVPAERLTTISYGQERPTCTEHNEACWQKNRRAHLTASR
jgi:peptidoglycan-associated lipoprotein